MKTSELTGVALDWAVAKIENPELAWGENIGLHWASNQLVIPALKEPDCYYSPSTNWAQGGPIIERERIGVEPHPGSENWISFINSKHQVGPTPLIAAMRCYVASELGDNIAIPQELLK